MLRSEEIFTSIHGWRQSYEGEKLGESGVGEMTREESAKDLYVNED